MSTFIHPTSIIGPEVSLGENISIGPYCIIRNCSIGSGTKIWSHSCIGTEAEHRDYFDSAEGFVVIGNDCVIREFTTINRGTEIPTIVGNQVIMLRGSHVGHDAHIENNVTLSCNVLIGGHAKIFKHSNLGLGSVVHQRCAVPSYTMLGMNSTWTKKTIHAPGGKYIGSPARLLGKNINAETKKYGDSFDYYMEVELERIKEWLKQQS